MAQIAIDDFAEEMFKDSLRAILYRVEVSELNNKPKNILGYDLGETFFFMGNIPSSIAQLTNTSVARLKFVGKVSDKNIGYWGERFNTYMIKGRRFVKPKNTEPVTNENIVAVINKITHQENQDDPANVMILNVLKMTYGFSVTDIEETCEVWVVKVSDESMLSTYVDIYNHHNGGAIKKDAKEYYQLTSFELWPLWDIIEKRSKHIVYDETGDKRRFTLLMESDNLDNFEQANEALRPLGLFLTKEKRLEKIKLVTFHD